MAQGSSFYKIAQCFFQAVPIGTKLQLRARINPDSAWRHIKLLEVAVSPDPDRPHAPGAVLLVKDGLVSRIIVKFYSLKSHLLVTTLPLIK